MKKVIEIIKSDKKSFTSFKFYNSFLKELKEYYHDKSYIGDPPDFSIEHSSYVDSPTLPLILGLGQYLKKHHRNKPIRLRLRNAYETNDILKYLFYSDFFKIASGYNYDEEKIFEFEESLIGGFDRSKELRKAHRIRSYSLNRGNLRTVLEQSVDSRRNNLENEEEQRDILIEHFTFVVEEHFKELLDDNKITQIKRIEFVDILSELISNSLLHSKTDCFALMNTNRYRTVISVVDTGVGLYSSIIKKEDSEYYTNLDIYKSISAISQLNISEKIEQHLFSIFEALFFSMLKNRRGLFDLLSNIVVESQGIFRIHNMSVQLIISSKFEEELNNLYIIRQKIFQLHTDYKYQLIKEEQYRTQIKEFSKLANKSFLKFCEAVFKGYTNDIQYSPIRVFQTEFKGVHIEAEIPKVK